ncbi:hypothetical protein MANAM107_09050 [Actinomyces capricornis]|uniref:histidine kinase n=2 Tax=Actinomyces capricornis TaxID=2755559 RepID=A0ABN6K526_9ACTO|nr:hypothetical protein MANAM107_09050 [Actinomyces capricornis]
MTWTIAAVTTLLVGFSTLVAVPATTPHYLPMLVLAGLACLVVLTMWLRRRDRLAYERSLAREAAARAVAEDRLAIVRDLHDTISGGLGAITVRAAVAQRLDSRPEELLGVLRDIELASREATDALRSMLGVLRMSGSQAYGTAPAPSSAPGNPLAGPRRGTGPGGSARGRAAAPGSPTPITCADGAAPQGALPSSTATRGPGSHAASPHQPPGRLQARQELAEALDALVARARRQGMEVRLSLAPELARRAHSLPAAINEAAIAVVREALSNTARHAGPTAATAALRLDDALHLRIVDDGPGPAWVPQPGTGMGLRGLSERVAALGGRLRAGARDDGAPGFAVEVHLPLAGAESEGPGRAEPGGTAAVSGAQAAPTAGARR